MSFKSWSAGLKPTNDDKAADKPEVPPAAAQPAPRPFVGPPAPTGKPTPTDKPAHKA